MSFIYEGDPDTTSLYQGDVVARTPEVDGILKQVHPHYLRSDYKAFLVLTQSCDLVLREDGQAKALYITIAAVRPLERVLEKTLPRQLKDPVEIALRFGSQDRKARLSQLIERVLNNNEPEYFYLATIPSQRLPGDLCAFLQLSIALKADLHYSTLLTAKVSQLTESFQHKLGWLVGTSYSRVGTDDWVPNHLSQPEFDARVARAVDALGITWLERPLADKALRRLKELPEADRTLEALEKILAELRRTKEQKRNAVLDIVGRRAVEVGIHQDLASQLTKLLRNDPGLIS